MAKPVLLPWGVPPALSSGLVLSVGPDGGLWTCPGFVGRGAVAPYVHGELEFHWGQGIEIALAGCPGGRGCLRDGWMVAHVLRFLSSLAFARGAVGIITAGQEVCGCRSG